MKRIAFILLVILVAGSSSAALRPDQKTPDFELQDRAGKTVRLADITGQGVKGVVLSFFASWCVPCRSELPLIESLTDELQKKGIKVVLVDVKEDVGTINALLAELQVHKPIVLCDHDGKTAERYQVRFFPTTFFVRADGTIADVIFGEIQGAAELRASAGKILK